MAREQGVIKWFSAPKGYGFIGRPNKPDCFVHFSAITGMEGYKTLQEGQKVEFEAVKGEKGIQAADVVVVE